MADIDITIGQDEEGKPSGPFLDLNIRKSIDGNLIVRDHPDIDIVVLLEKRKIVTFPKNEMTEEVYQTQDKFFDFLAKRGIIAHGSVQGGSVYTAMEAKIPETSGNPLKLILLNISKFIEEERPYFEFLEAFEEYQEERLTDPSEEESSEYDSSRHDEKKGVLNPIYVRSPYGINFIYEGKDA